MECMTGESREWRLGHRPALDGLRGVAVLLVLADHGGLLPEPAGQVGVGIFFVLSGFLISRVIIEAREEGRWSFVRFFGNRVARLAPALVVMVAATSAWWIEVGTRPSEVAGRAARTLTYSQNFFMGGDLASPFLHTWSLAVEEQFYLVWPFVLGLLLARGRVLRGIAWMAAGSVALRFLMFAGGWHELAQASLLTNACALLLGCALALHDPARWSRRWMTPVGWAGIALAIEVGSRLPDPFLAPPVVAAAFSVLLVAGAAGGSAVLKTSPLRFVGRISYAAYLWHYPLLIASGSPKGWQSLPILALSLAFATASTLLLEEPVRRWWRGRSVPTGSAVGGDASAGQCGRVEGSLVNDPAVPFGIVIR